MFDDDKDPRERANQAAARAVRAWLLTVGLAVEIEALRFPGDGAPVPAPGLELIQAKADEAARAASDAADLVAKLMDGFDLDDDLEAWDRALSRAEEAEGAADDAERAAWDMAQLGFGVSSCLASSDRVERLDRAAVAILHPPIDPSTQWIGLAEDGVLPLSGHRSELVVEVAGAICRALIDRNSGARLQLATGGPEVRFYVDADDALHLWLPDGSEQVYESPLTVIEPAKEVVSVLYDHASSPRA